MTDEFKVPEAGRRKQEERPTHIKDARGRKVTQLDPVEMRLLRRHQVVEPEELEAMADEIGSGLDPKQRKLMKIFGFFIGLLAIVFVIHTADVCLSGQWRKTFEIFNIGMLNLWIWPVIAFAQARRSRFKKTMKVMLKHRRCPHCGYDLRGLPLAAEDEATVCPECGCAWMIENQDEIEG